MAYGQGNIITANDVPDFNSLRTAVNQVFADNNSGSTAQPAATFGYGSTPVLGPVAPGDTITAAQWSSLFNATALTLTHQGTAAGSFPSAVSSGDVITAFEGGAGLLARVNSLAANRFLLGAGQSTITSGGARLSSTRTANWNNSLTHQFSVNFGSYDNARYFFNSGGQIRLSASRSGGPSTPQNTAWSNMLSSMGTISMDYTQSIRSGTTGTVSSIGYYDLTTTFQTIFTASPLGMYYSSDSYVLQARITGTTPAGRSSVEFRAIFTTQPGPEAVSGTITSNVDDRRSTGAITRPIPSYTQSVPLTAGT